MPDSVKHLEVYLFADDTNVACGRQDLEVFNKDTSKICQWLTANKLTFSKDKSVFVNCKTTSNASSINISLKKNDVSPQR